MLDKGAFVYWQSHEDAARLLLDSFSVGYHLMVSRRYNGVEWSKSADELMGPRCTKTPEQQLRGYINKAREKGKNANKTTMLSFGWQETKINQTIQQAIDNGFGRTKPMARSPAEVKLIYGNENMDKLLIVIAMQILGEGGGEARGWGLGKRVWEQMLADEGPEMSVDALCAWHRAVGYGDYN
jgi:hypothetical protein